MVKCILIASVLGTSIILSACSDRRIIEEIGFIQSASYDRSADGQLIIAISIPKADSGSKVSREEFLTTARSAKEARITLSRQSQLTLASGQLRNVLFGCSLARLGIWEHIDSLVRDTVISPQVRITLVDGDAAKLLTRQYKQHPIPGRYIEQLLEKSSRNQTVPKVTLHDFVKEYYEEGIDPVAPIIRDKGDHVEIGGIGLFRDDRYVASLHPEEALIFAFLRGKFNQGEIIMDLGSRNGIKETAMLSAINSKRRITVNFDQGVPTVYCHARIQGSIMEYNGTLKISDIHGRHQLETQIAQNVTERANKMIRLMQNNGVDSLGIGRFVRNSMSYSGWKSLDWMAKYPEVKVIVNVSVFIKDVGKLKI
ncbi:Ger(x)C family spore germination protein [Cohnella lupini]|uniref:Spore germination protein n=1 Tax=Cohnella lupini TaxID=1294267 RepID=A0A3D9HNU5_9BACL|nr:Ger(x)C family spore germination protein [Cohnella lupini]RED51147.1 spore germination protein [Cohnella lupini]